MYFYNDNSFNKNKTNLKDKIGIIPNAIQPGIFLFISEYDNNYFERKSLNHFKIGD